MNKHKIFRVNIKSDYFHGLRISPNVYIRLLEIDRFADAMTLVAEVKVKEVLTGKLIFIWGDYFVMRRLFSITFFLFISFAVIAQNKNSEKDSTAISPNLNRYFEYMQELSWPDIVRPENFLISTKFDTTQNGSIWLRTRLAVTNSIQQNSFESPSYLLQPYYNFYMESKGISLFRRVLGMAQLGAVGYIAYKHLKKYGLFH